MPDPMPTQPINAPPEDTQPVVWILDPEIPACVYLSPSLQQLLGYMPEELQAAPLNARPLLRDAQDFTPMLRQRLQAFMTGQAPAHHYYTDELELLKKDGTAVWTETISNFALNPKTGRVELHGITHDISKRVQSRLLLHQQTQELASINALSHSFKLDLALDQTLNTALQGTLDALHPDVVFIFMREGDRLVLKKILPESARQRFPAIPEHCLGECLCGLAVRDDQPLYSRNIHLDPRCTWTECKLAGLTSLAVLPLHDFSETLGVLGIASEAPRNFEDQAGFLETLAGQISQAISHARLLETAQHELAARQQAESAYHESEDRYRSIVESSPLAMHFYQLARDGALQLIGANPAADRMLGIAHQPLFGRTIEAAFPNLAETEIPNLYRRVASGALGPQNFESAYQDERFSGVYDVRVFRTGPGRIAVNFLDISDRKRAEEALNKRIIALTQPLGNTDISLTEMFNLEELQAIQDAFASATGVASIITRPDGVPITRASNFCRLCQDLIRKTEQGLKNCMCSDASIGRHNPGGPIVQRCLSGGLWDAGASITVGGRHIANWLIGQVKNEGIDEDRMLAYARELGLDEQAFREALAQVPVMPEKKFREISNFLFLIASELSLKAYQNIQQARFIDDLKKAGAALRAKEEQLRHAQRLEAVGQLAGGIAHDFNNLLSVITGYAEYSLDWARDVAPLRSNLDNILKATERATWLTRQLLAFSRKQVLEPKIVNLNQVIEAISGMLARLLGEHIELNTRLLPGLGPVKVDPGQIEQVLMNLAVNARDAMPDGGQLTLSTAHASLEHPAAEHQADFAPGEHVLLTVEDTGCGMDEQTVPKIFEPFFTTKTPDKGTGLGLATVYGIVLQSKGAITVESRPGHGAVFRLYFPRAGEAVPQLSQKADLPAPAKTGETILVVEDIEAIRKYVLVILKAAGYAVLSAADGLEGLQASERHPGKIDLLLTDVIMPRLNGAELADRLSAARPGIKILFTSGYADEAIVREGLAKNKAAFIAKPYLKNTLLAKVRETLDA